MCLDIIRRSLTAPVSVMLRGRPGEKVYSKFPSLRQWLRRKMWVVQSPPLGSRLRGVDCGPWRNADVKNNSPVLGILIVDFFLGGLRPMNASNPALLLTVPKFMRSVWFYSGDVLANLGKDWTLSLSGWSFNILTLSHGRIRKLVALS